MVDIDSLHLPPHNIEAEKGFLSAIFLDNEIIYMAEGENLQPADFYQKEHQIIFEGIKELWSSRKTIDVITLADTLTKKGELDKIGGNDYLYEISTFSITPTVASDYCKIILEKSVLRKILKASQKIIGDVYEEKSAVDVLDQVEKRIFDITQINFSDSMLHIRDILEPRYEHYYEISNDQSKLEKDKVFSGYNFLDTLLGGFKPGELIVLAARPSMGKTSFALNLLVKAAVKQKKSVAIFSLEMSSEQIVDRILATVSEISFNKISKGLLDEQDFSSIGEAMEQLGESHIYIDDRGGATVPELKSKLRRLKIEKGGIDLVIIDYLQLMSGTNSSFAGNRVQEISEITRGLKELARELKIPIIALSQLSRAVEQRPDKRPHLSDLRESGAIEQDADAVMMLYREEYYDPDDEENRGKADIYVRKNRNGPTGEVKLKFEKQTMKFFDIEQQQSFSE